VREHCSLALLYQYPGPIRDDPSLSSRQPWHVDENWRQVLVLVFRSSLGVAADRTGARVVQVLDDGRFQPTFGCAADRKVTSKSPCSPPHRFQPTVGVAADRYIRAVIRQNDRLTTSPGSEPRP
jgi:hypothetical protein